MLIMCDLDGTVADNSHRAGFIQAATKDWNTFYTPEQITKDRPIEKAVKVVNRLIQRQRDNLTFHFLTGRPERTREVTEEWLHKHLNLGGQLLPTIWMRRDGDHTSADKFKEDVVCSLPGQESEPILFIDDDLRNCEMYWRYGIFLHAPGCWDSFVLEAKTAPYGPHPG